MSSDQGIAKIRKSDFAAYDAGQITRLTPTAYGKIDGMKSVECNGQGLPSAWKTRDGKNWFPT